MVVEALMLLPAQPADFPFCQRTYFEPMRETIEKLGLDQATILRISLTDGWSSKCVSS